MISLVHGKATPPPSLNKPMSKNSSYFSNPLILMGNFGSLVAKILLLLLLLLLLPPQLTREKQNPLSKLNFDCPTQKTNT
jgi:hypothetical protein